MNESLRRSVSRLSSRTPYPASHGPPPGHPLGSSPSLSMEAEMTDVLRRAKLDIERLRKKERNQRRKRWMKERISWQKKKNVSLTTIHSKDSMHDWLASLTWQWTNRKSMTPLTPLTAQANFTLWSSQPRAVVASPGFELPISQPNHLLSWFWKNFHTNLRS